MSRAFPPADRALSALLRALAPHLGPHRLIAASSRDWASATFVGSRHRFAIALEGGDALARADRLRARLAETDLPLAGGFVADMTVGVRIAQDDPVVDIEALIIAEAPMPAPDAALSRDARPVDSVH